MTVVNAALALLAILSLVLLFRFSRRVRPAVGTHPVGTTPIPPSPGADRLNHWIGVLLRLERRERLVAICELHRDGLVDTDMACALIDEVA